MLARKMINIILVISFMLVCGNLSAEGKMEEVVGEFLAGIVGDFVGAVAGFAVGNLLFETETRGDDEFGPAFLGVIAGQAVGSSIGVYLAGISNNNNKSSYWTYLATLGGSTLFTSSYILYEIIYGIPENGVLQIFGHLIMPVTGAIIGFNLTKKSKSVVSLFHIEDGRAQLSLPTLTMQTTKLPNAKAHPRTDYTLRLVSVRF